MKNDNNNTNLLHYTYNPIKMNFLKNRGMKYLVEGINGKTGKKFWTYLKGQELNEKLREWRAYQEERFDKK